MLEKPLGVQSFKSCCGDLGDNSKSSVDNGCLTCEVSEEVYESSKDVSMSHRIFNSEFMGLKN